jgi:cell fate (sporulation/competence/biofilm development) regulator YmcA (YheA/YmcA/DUF963 family)
VHSDLFPGRTGVLRLTEYINRLQKKKCILAMYEKLEANKEITISSHVNELKTRK